MSWVRKSTTVFTSQALLNHPVLLNTEPLLCALPRETFEHSPAETHTLNKFVWKPRFGKTKWPNLLHPRINSFLGPLNPGILKWTFHWETHPAGPTHEHSSHRSPFILQSRIQDHHKDKDKLIFCVLLSKQCWDYQPWESYQTKQT